MRQTSTSPQQPDAATMPARLAMAALAAVLCLHAPSLRAQSLNPELGNTEPAPGGTGAGTSIDPGPAAGEKDTPDAPPENKDAPPPPPPTLPGSHAQPTEAAPADRAANDMDPNTALYDAINRGDSVAARDSINRGADLDGHNVLGLTPLELAVDLGRNDIAFLLLSLRTPSGAAPDTTLRHPHALPASATRRTTRTTPPPAATQAGAAPDAGFMGFGGS